MCVLCRYLTTSIIIFCTHHARSDDERDEQDDEILSLLFLLENSFVRWSSSSSYISSRIPKLQSLLPTYFCWAFGKKMEITFSLAQPDIHFAKQKMYTYSSWKPQSIYNYMQKSSWSLRKFRELHATCCVVGWK